MAPQDPHKRVATVILQKFVPFDHDKTKRTLFAGDSSWLVVVVARVGGVSSLTAQHFNTHANIHERLFHRLLCASICSISRSRCWTIDQETEARWELQHTLCVCVCVCKGLFLFFLVIFSLAHRRWSLSPLSPVRTHRSRAFGR